jgi:erythromycin esterase-like protein
MSDHHDGWESSARPLERLAASDEELIGRCARARIVCIGEASHGSHEFYAERAAITRRLIVDHGFQAVAAEADWPDAYRVNHFVRGVSDDHTAEEALGDFIRFPTWMWRNTVVRDFVGWLAGHNAQLPEARRAGFYGLDLYSLHRSIEAVLRYLQRVDPEAAVRARERYSCFEQLGGDDPQQYGYATGVMGAEPCEEKVVEQLLELHERSAELSSRDERLARDAQFFAEQNARVVLDAERYYRAMFSGRAKSWNLRDQHMADTLDGLCAHLGDGGQPAKVVVWAHNSHLGDARATEMSTRGELNVGQLVRERHGADTVLVGFTTHSGTVTAATDWDGPAERKRVLPGREDAWEGRLHHGGPRFWLDLADADESLRGVRLERAIGVIYRPETERWSHYFHARLADQFDALIHLDRTTALEALPPLEPAPAPDLPETYPTGV